jgi:hypothetical protein
MESASCKRIFPAYSTGSEGVEETSSFAQPRAPRFAQATSQALPSSKKRSTAAVGARYSGRPEDLKMQKKVRFCSAGTAAILLMCGKFACPAPALAGQSKSAALPATGDLVQNGTHFLVRLDQEMNTGKDKVNKKFEVRTIEPLETSSGYVLPAGVKIVGHISRIEPGGLTGRARLWLTFDDIDTRRGTLPIVAEVSSVPGEYSVRQGVSKEGEIEARAGKGTQVVEATAAGAAMGSAAGVTAHNSKAAAMGAAAGAAAGFLASSGIGQEMDLPKGTKLELVLDRPLYLNQ